MRNLVILFIITIALFTTSCSSLISTSQAKNSYLPVERTYYAQSSIINKQLYNEQKAAEVKSVTMDTEKSAIEELKDIHEFALNSFVSQILSEAETYLGTPYKYGGTTRHGIDCSSFVQQVFEMFNYELPRVSAAQAKEGREVSKDEIKAGDLVFFSTSGRGRVSHVGIVHSVTEDGDIEFIHASTSQGVIVTPLSDNYWGKRYLYAKRILD